ncbi:MAG: hypothetical protein HQL30_01860 [Candidatus Omnitrophica bacterium]|nr:hypothetical protein [Candidatus Omnitrophota bacterium]
MAIVAILCGAFFGVVWDLLYKGYLGFIPNDTLAGKMIRPYMDMSSATILSVLWPFFLLGFCEKYKAKRPEGVTLRKYAVDTVKAIWNEKKDNFVKTIVACWLIWYPLQLWNINRIAGSGDMVSAIAVFELPWAIFWILLAGFKGADKSYGSLPGRIASFGVGSFIGFFMLRIGVLYGILGFVDPFLNILAPVSGLIAIWISENYPWQKKSDAEPENKISPGVLAESSSLSPIPDSPDDRPAEELMTDPDNAGKKRILFDYLEKSSGPDARNISDPEEVAKGLIETVISKLLEKDRKIVIAVHHDINAAQTEDIAGLLRTFTRLKGSRGFRELMSDLVIIPSFTSGADLEEQLKRNNVDSLKKDDVIFTFNPSIKNNVISVSQGSIIPVFIDDNAVKGGGWYYPLAEIILITLMKYHLNRTAEQLKDIFGPTALSGDNIGDIMDSGTEAYLIFTILPKTEKYPPGERVDRCARIKQFLMAA